MKKTFELIAPCHFGMEAVLKREITDLGYDITLVEDGRVDGVSTAVCDWADLVLCTGSTVCNGSIVNFLHLKDKILFYGTTLAGAAALMGLPRICFADRYQ